MEPAFQITLSLALTLGVPLVLAVRELVALRRGSGGPWDRSAPEILPLPPVGPIATPLPSCLMPSPQWGTGEKARQRRPELV